MAKNIFYSGPSLEQLHEQYVKQNRIDTSAPVVASSEVVIKAPIERVWQVLSNLAAWPKLLPGVTTMMLQGEIGANTTFVWKNSGSTIHSKLAVVEPNAQLSWTGLSMGVKAAHRYVLTPEGSNQTRLATEESMAGLLTLFFSSTKLHDGQISWGEAIKAACEASAS